MMTQNPQHLRKRCCLRATLLVSSLPGASSSGHPNVSPETLQPLSQHSPPPRRRSEARETGWASQSLWEVPRDSQRGGRGGHELLSPPPMDPREHLTPSWGCGNFQMQPDAL